MDDDRFWAFVGAARDAAGDDVQDRVGGLEQVLLDQHPDEVVAFQHKYDELIARACRWDLWGAACVMNGVCSDDGFRYFRDWLISEGEAVYEAALADPESLADIAQDEEFELESFGYVAAEVYEQMTDVEMAQGRSVEPAAPAGKAWRADDLPTLLPRLGRKYDELLARACRWDLWGAAFLMNGGCSDDGFRYFRDWLISEGETAYEAALAEPDSLADVAQDEEFELESFGYVAAEVYEQMTDATLPRGVAADPAEPSGKPWEEDDLPGLFPRLARKHG